MIVQSGQFINVQKRNMENKHKLKEYTLIYLVVIIALLGVVAFFSLIDPSITGFAISNETNETNKSYFGEKQIIQKLYRYGLLQYLHAKRYFKKHIL